jgi:hypothetical protein
LKAIAYVDGSLKRMTAALANPIVTDAATARVFGGIRHEQDIVAARAPRVFEVGQVRRGSERDAMVGHDASPLQSFRAPFFAPLLSAISNQHLVRGDPATVS